MPLALTKQEKTALAILALLVLLGVIGFVVL